MQNLHTPKTRPCKRGHAAGRYANGACKECHRIRRLAERERHRIYGHEYRAANMEKTLLRHAQRRARKGGYPCTITVHDIVMPEFCPLLGVKLSPNGTYAPSLDKIRPELGYVPGNVWVVSRRANTLKNDATLDELETLVKRLRNALSD